MTEISIRSTTKTRKRLEETLRRAFKAGDVALVKRVTALLALVRGEPADAVAASVGVGRATLYAWLRAFLGRSWWRAWRDCTCSGRAGGPRS